MTNLTITPDLFLSSYRILFWIILGALGALFLQRLFSNQMLRKLKLKASLVKAYWRFVIIFVLFATLLYLGVFLFSSEKYLSICLAFVGQVLALIFAIFVGWYAFIQVTEGRIEKSGEQAHVYFKEGSYKRARELYEKIFLIAPKNFSNLTELQELNLITGNNSGFVDKEKKLEEAAIEDDEFLVIFYLQIMNLLLKQDLGNAESKIDECLAFSTQNPRALSQLAWSFTELKTSEAYKKLKGDPKKIADNFINYLSNTLNEEQRKKFEEGDYRGENWK
jgi:tetratricopeptide (TPR) repeat protein